MKEKYLFISLFILLTAVGGFAIGRDVVTQNAQAQVGGSFQANKFIRFSTSSAITIPGTTGGTNQQLLATNTARIYAAIVNDCSSVVYLGFNGNPAIINSGIRLNANGGSYEINEQNLYIGAISGTSTASCVVTVVEK